MDIEVGYNPGDEILPLELTVGQDLYLIRQLQDHSWQLHFTPDGMYAAVEGREREFALRFIQSFNRIIQWWNDPTKNPHSDIDSWECVANLRQWNFMVRTYGPQVFVMIETDAASGNVIGRVYPKYAIPAEIQK